MRQQVQFQIGPFRIRVGRLLSGGLCPLNVLGKDWSAIPHLRSQDDSQGADPSPSPAILGKRFLSLLLKAVTRRKTE